MRHRLMWLGCAGWFVTAWLTHTSGRTHAEQLVSAHAKVPQFQTANNCLACHNDLTTPAGEDVSIGSAWRGSIMANSSRDPYWQASVRRETMDHPSIKPEIEDECSLCHMPMATTQARAAGRLGRVFEHLPFARRDSNEDRLAADGVSCTLCHQIGTDRLGTPESFTGGFRVNPPSASGAAMFGPFSVETGLARVMQSATGVTPTEAKHIQQSEMCATCHTLYTHARGETGEIVGRLPEQVPYLEWRHSAYRGEKSCQSCHMPEVAEPTPVTSVLGQPRQGFSRHVFAGGNFFMLRMLNRYRSELGVTAQPIELEGSARATLAQLQSDTATVSVLGTRAGPASLEVEVTVRNLTGHKFPTAYPSRRAWLQVTVSDRDGRLLFESGAVGRTGAIHSNDNDVDPRRYEAHHDVIRRPEDVQIYESILVDASGAVTTGLLRGASFVKDNRLLPRGFDKVTAGSDIAVRGGASTDENFAAGADRVRYLVDTEGAQGPFNVDVELRYQPISFRWAHNLTSYDADEPRRFVTYYESMAAQSSALISRAGTRVP